MKKNHTCRILRPRPDKLACRSLTARVHFSLAKLTIHFTPSNIIKCCRENYYILYWTKYAQNDTIIVKADIRNPLCSLPTLPQPLPGRGILTPAGRPQISPTSSHSALLKQETSLINFIQRPQKQFHNHERIRLPCTPIPDISIRLTSI